MNIDSADFKIYIGAIFVIVLQLFVAPIISINSVIPNLILSFTVVCVVIRPDKMHLIFAFLMGLMFDILFNGVVGVMAFVLLICCFIVSRFLLRIEEINLGISLLVVTVTIFFAEMFYGMFQAAFTVNAAILDVLSYKILPCTIYDIILAFVFFALMVRLIAPPVIPGSEHSSSNQINNHRWQ